MSEFHRVMRPLLFAALIAVPAFAQDDFYARQLENQMYQRQAEARQFEVQRVEQQRVRLQQDRTDQADTDARFAAQQKALYGQRRTYSPGTIPRVVPKAPTCALLKLPGTSRIDAEMTGAFGSGTGRIVSSVYRFGPEGQSGTLIVSSRFGTNGELRNEINRHQTSITFYAADDTAWEAVSGEVIELDVDPSRRAGHATLKARNIVFQGPKGTACARLPELSATARWKR